MSLDALAEFVRSYDHCDVEGTGRDSEQRVAHGIMACCTGVFDACYGDVCQAESVRENAGRKAVWSSHRTEPGRLQIGLVQALVDTGGAFGERHGQQVFDTQGEMLGKGCHPRADYRHVSHTASCSIRNAVSGSNAYP